VVIPVLVIAEEYGGRQLKSYLTNGTVVTAVLQGDPNPRILEWDGPKEFGAVDVTAGFAVSAPGIYPMRLVANQEENNANLEWFSIRPDGTKVLINDTSQPDALRAFRERTGGGAGAQFNLPVLTSQGLTLSWSGSGTLQEATSLPGTWTSSPAQTNPQTVPITGTMKFYRIKQE
jgi:hypothetical protein